jgi:hypothetical protein
MGPDRLTMLRYGINDLRLFFEGDLRFLSPIPFPGAVQVNHAIFRILAAQPVQSALSSEELCHLLTMAGLEVEENEPVAPEFSGVVVAHVLSVEKASRRRQAQALLASMSAKRHRCRSSAVRRMSPPA